MLVLTKTLVIVAAILLFFKHLRQALSLDHLHYEVHCAFHLIIEGVVHFDDVVVADAAKKLVLFVSDFDELNIIGANYFYGESLISYFKAWTLRWEDR